MELRIKNKQLLVGKTKKMEVATREELKAIIKVAVEQLQSMNNQNYPCISIVVSTFPCDGKDTSSILVYWILYFGQLFKWLKMVDCKSTAVCFGGSNPTGRVAQKNTAYLVISLTV